MAPCLVLGLGNDILCDDAVGLRVVRALKDRLSHPDLEIAETSEMGLALLDFFSGRTRVILVDSVLKIPAPPEACGRTPTSAAEAVGGVREIVYPGPAPVPGAAVRTPHFLGVQETLALGHRLGLEMPGCVVALGIEVADPYTLSERMSPGLELRLPGIIEEVSRRVTAVLGSPG